MALSAALGTLIIINNKVKQRNGVLEVSGSERTITIKWDPTRLDEAAVRRILEELGRAVR